MSACHDACPYFHLWGGACKCGKATTDDDAEARTVQSRYHTTTYYPTNDDHTCRLCGAGFAGGRGIDALLAIHLAEHALDQLDSMADDRREQEERE